MRVLCTGGAGYVGSACLRYLLGEGHDVFAYDDLSEGNRLAVPEHEDRLLLGDIRDKDKLARVLTERRIDVVMHFAAVASVPDSIRDPALYWDVNLVGTKSVLDAMRGAGVTKIVLSSTAATYGFSEASSLTESSPQVPVTPYGTSKMACEALLREYALAYGFGCASMRYFNASGADLDGAHGEDRRHESHLIPLVLAAALGVRDEVLIFGDDWTTPDGTCVRDYVHVRDIAQAHALAMGALTPGSAEAYNIGSGVGLSVREIVAA
ncbi:MAG: UDP-glucose 4-epimerase GalE, partial [Chloroflexi bacterium]|nr:UDP-glucose 4-epimerase GalE [Chloroflexota bacterium]